MTRAAENPPAFPSRKDEPITGGGSYRNDRPGMSLRDWFAGQIAGHLAIQYHGNDKEHAPIVARKAYAVADALLAARGDGQ